MSEQKVICDHGEMCGEVLCHHKTEHEEIGHCQETLRACWKGIGGVKCIPVKPPKPTRKRSAPLYGELLNQNKRLEIENHSLKITVDILKNAPLFGVLLWWFRNRKGGGK